MAASSSGWWLHLVAAGFLFLLATVVDGSSVCTEDSYVDPGYSFTGNANSTTASECSQFCSNAGVKISFLSENTHCLCSNNDTGTPTPYASGCGITATISFARIVEDPAVCDGCYFTLNALVTDTYKVDDDVVVSMLSNYSSVVVEWNDVAMDLIDPAVIAEIFLSYPFPGYYNIFVYPTYNVADVTVNSVIIHSTPNITGQCDRLIEVGTIGYCNVTMETQGLDFVLSMVLDPPLASIYIAAPMPTPYSNIRGYWTDTGTVSEMEIPGDDLLFVIGNMKPSTGGPVNKVMAKGSGYFTFGLYALYPKCAASASVWCGIQGRCNSATHCDVTSSSTRDFSTSSYSQSYQTMTTGATAYTTMFIAKVDSSVMVNGIFELIEPVYVPFGSYFAIGCLTDGNMCSATVPLMSLYDNITQTADRHAIYNSTTKLAEITNDVYNTKYLVQVLEEETLGKEFSFTVNCSVSTPYTNVVTISGDSALENLVNKTSTNATIIVKSLFDGSSSSLENEILCQEKINGITVLPDIWTVYTSNSKYSVEVLQGSPIFISTLIETDMFAYSESPTTFLFTLDYSVPGTKQLTGNVSNLLNFETFSSIIYVIPAVNNATSITAMCPCFDVPEGFNFTFDLPVINYQPWNFSVSIKSDNGSNVLDDICIIGSEAIPVLSESTSCTLHTTILTAGSYNMSVNISNEVSYSLKYIEVTVEEGLRDVSAEIIWLVDDVEKEGMGINGTIYMTNKTVVIMPKARTGTPEYWSVYIHELDELLTSSTANENFTYTFTQDGKYTITVSGFNTVQKYVDSTPLLVETVSKLKGFELLDDGKIRKPNEVMPIKVVFSILPPSSCLVLDFGDDTQIKSYGFESLCKQNYSSALYTGQTLEFEQVIDHIYMDEGIYVIRGIAFDSQVTLQDSLEIVVADIPCSMPLVWIVNNATEIYAPSLWRSDSFRLQGVSAFDCNATVPVSRRWSLTHIDEITMEPIREYVVEMVLPSWNLTELTVNPLFLDVGLHKVTYSFTLHASKIYLLTRQGYTYVKIIPSPLVPKLMDGGITSVSRGFGQLLELYPWTLSYDPDDPENMVSMNVTVFCRLSTESDHAQVDGRYIPYNPQTLPKPYAALPLTGGGCLGVGPGTIVSLENQPLVINTASFNQKSATYEITLQIEKDVRVSSAHLEVELSPFPPPVVNFKCISADLCWYYKGNLIINPSSRLALQGACTEECDSGYTSTWQIWSGSKEALNEAEMDCSQIPADECTPTFPNGKNQDDFVVSQHFFSNNVAVPSYLVRLSIRNSANVTGFAEAFVLLNKAPVNGNCILSASTGTALVKSYDISCSKWEDPENIGIDSYTFYYTYDSDKGPVTSTLATTSKNELNLVFPYGQFRLTCQILDTWGAITEYFIGNITTILPSKEELDAFQADVKIGQLASNGEEAELSMLLVALASVRDNADFLSLNFSNEKNISTDAVNTLISTITKMRQNSLTTALNSMQFGTMSQLNVGAGIFQSVLQGGNNDIHSALSVDMNARDMSVNLLENLVKSLQNMKIDSPYSLQTFLGSSLSAATTMFGTLAQLIANAEAVGPEDLKNAVNWDYDTSVPEDIYAEIPLSMEEKIKQNIIESTLSKAKSQSDRLISSFKAISKEVLKRSVPGETVKTKSPNGASFIISKLTEEILQKGYIIESEAHSQKAIMQFPKNFCPSRYKIQNTNCKQEIGIVAAIWPQNIHSYSLNSDIISRKSSIFSMNILIREEKVDIVNEKLPFKFEIPRAPEEIPKPLHVNNASYINDILPFVYHYFNITKLMSALTVEIKHGKSSQENMILLLDYKRMPTLSKFEKCILVENNPHNFSSVFMNSDEINNRTGAFYIAIGFLKVVPTDIKTKSSFEIKDFVEDFVLDYYFRVFSSACYYFNEMETIWFGKGMRVVYVDYNKTVCEAFHLTSFGSGYFPVSNSINFEYVFTHAGFIDNVTLYLVIIITLLCYIIMIIWARFMDKADYKKLGVIPLNDNRIEDKYIYEVTFYTGPDKEAATESQINFIISGEFGETEIRCLPKSKDLYRRYAINTFVMTTPGPLGDIFYIRVFHDNSGIAPRDTWQLQMVVIRDLQTRAKCVFSTETWLAFNREDGAIDKTFTPNVTDTNFSNEMYKNVNSSTNEDNMWIAMFLKSAGSRFSRMERVTVAAVFWFLSMVVSAVWTQTSSEGNRSGYFDLGPFNLDSEQMVIGLISLIIVYPVVIFLIILFKRARPRQLKKCRAIEAIENQRKIYFMKHGEETDNATLMSRVTLDAKNNQLPKDFKSIKCFPWWTRLVAWTICSVCIVISVFFVWAYGITWGEIKTVKWFSAFIIGFLLSLLFTQWLKVLLFALIASVICKNDFSTQDIDCDEELPHLKKNEEWNNIGPLANDYERKVHKIEGVDPDDPYVANLRNKLTKEREMAFVIRGILMYCIFLIVLYVMVNSRTDYNGFLLQEHLKATFIQFGIEDQDFSQVASTNDLWLWIKNVILKELLSQRNYNGGPPYGLRGFLNDQTNRAIGYGIIRQIRINRHSCFTQSPTNKLIFSCTGSRGFDVEERTNFCALWKKNSTFKNSCRYKEFHYKTDKELNTFGMIGKLGEYGGGGFVFELRGPQKSLTDKMEELQKLQWLDKYTRAVILEFSVYNANVNLFAMCQVIAEFNEGGGIVPQWRFEPVRLLPDSGIKGIVTLVCEIAFVVITALFTLREAWSVKKMKCSYFKSYWNLAELCIIAISYTAIALYVYKKILISQALEIFTATYGNGYIRIDSAVHADLLYLYAVSFIVFFSTVKLIKLLQFNKRMDVLAQTIRLCWDDLSIFFIAFALIFIAFSTLFFFIFRTTLMDFSEFPKALATCFLMMIGKFDSQSMTQADPMSPFLFFTFSLINSFILINIMLTIILVAFNQVQKNLVNQENKYDIIDYVWSKFHIFMRKEVAPNNAVIPSRDDKVTEKRATEELPRKINLLLKHINEAHFEGKLDLSNPKILKAFTEMQGAFKEDKRCVYMSN